MAVAVVVVVVVVVVAAAAFGDLRGGIFAVSFDFLPATFLGC
jgi:hypothetical protein